MTDKPLFIAPPAIADADLEPPDDDLDDDSGDRPPPRSAYSGPAYIRRIDHLNRAGRRCAGNNSTCINAATRRLRVVALDPNTGEPRRGAEPGDVLTCSRHDKNWSRNAVYQVLEREQLPPRT